MTPDAPPYQAQDTARMKVRGRVLGRLAEDTVIIRCDADGNVDPDGSPIVLRGARPTAPPDAHFLVIWARQLTPDVHPVDEIPTAEAMRLVDAWTAVPRASAVARSLDREVKRLRKQLANEGLPSASRIAELEAETERLTAVTVAQHAELVRLRADLPRLRADLEVYARQEGQVTARDQRIVELETQLLAAQNAAAELRGDHG